jgi:hypothetical protein
MNDQDHDDSSWAQAEQEERRQREDALLAHCGIITAESLRETAEFQEHTRQFWQRVLGMDI